MRATCFKGVSHQTFRREVELEGVGNEILDDNLNVVAIGSPHILRVRRPASTVYCARCGEQAHVTIAPEAA